MGASGRVLVCYGYASANASLPGWPCARFFRPPRSANQIGERFCRRERADLDLYLDKESRVAEIWILGTQTLGPHERRATEAREGGGLGGSPQRAAGELFSYGYK